MEINNLRGSFLSNFYESSIELDGIVYRNAEAAYQAMKSNDNLVRVKFINLNGANAKALGKRIELRKDWNNIKLDIMYKIIKNKFTQNPTLTKLLVDTNDKVIIEGNTWGDTYWGMCKGKGENHLGKILMKVREEIKLSHHNDVLVELSRRTSERESSHSNAKEIK